MRLVEIGKTKEDSPLATLADDIERNEVAWKEWAALEAPEAALMPADLTAKLSLFEQLLVSLDTLLCSVCVCVCVLVCVCLSGMCSALMHASGDLSHEASQLLQLTTSNFATNTQHRDAFT